MKIFALSLSVILFSSNVLLAYAPETNFWEERRKKQSQTPNPVLAQLPSVGPSAFPGVDSVRPSLPTPSLVENLKKESQPDRDLSKLSRLVSHLSQNGTLRDLRLAEEDKPILVYIQDIHGQKEAQKNIAGMILSVLDENPDTLVALEGAAGDMPIQDFRLSTNEVNKEVGSFFFNSGLITGAEYAGFAAVKQPRFFGVEDVDLYLENAQAAQDSLAIQKETQIEVEKQITELNHRKRDIYSEALQKLDQKTNAYHKNKIGVGDYLAVLSSISPVPKKYKHVSLFLKTWRLEKTLDFDRAERQRRTFLTRLVEKLNQPGIDQLIEWSVALRAGRMTYPDYYGQLKVLSQKAGVTLSSLPEFDRYISYVLQSDAIQPEEFLKEVNRVEKDAWETLLETSEQKEVYATSVQLRLEEKLVSLKMTPNEWKDYKEIEARPFPHSESFYRAVEKRDHAMTSNLKKKLAQSPSDIVILVAGGFHKDGFNQYLSNGDFTFITVAPKLTKMKAGDHDYLNVFTREKTPLEKLFQAPTISMVMTLAMDPVAPGLNPSADVVGELNKPVSSLIAKVPPNDVVKHRTPNYDLVVAGETASLPARTDSIHQARTDEGRSVGVWPSPLSDKQDRFKWLPRLSWPVVGSVFVFIAVIPFFGMDITGLIVLGLVMGSFLSMLPANPRHLAEQIAGDRGQIKQQADNIPILVDAAEEHGQVDFIEVGLHRLLPFLEGASFDAFWKMLWDPGKRNIVGRLKSGLVAYRAKGLYRKNLGDGRHNLSNALYSPGGQFLVVFRAKSFVLIDRWNNMKEHEYKEHGAARGFRFSPDGRSASFLDSKHKMKILDLERMEVLPDPSEGSAAWNEPARNYDGGYSPNGNYLYWNERGQFVVLDQSSLTGARSWRFNGRLYKVSFSLDEQRMIFTDLKDYFLLDLSDPEAEPELLVNAEVKPVFTPDLGQVFWWTGQDAYLLNLSDPDREPIKLPSSGGPYNEDYYRKVEMSPNGRFVAFSTPYASYVIDRFASDEIRVYVFHSAINLTFSPDNQYFAMSTTKDAFLSPLRESEFSLDLTRVGIADRNLAFSPNGQYFVRRHDVSIYVRDLWAEPDAFPAPYPVYGGSFHQLAFGLDSQRLVISTEEGLYLYNLKTSGEHHTWSGHFVFQISPDGRTLIYSGQGATFSHDLSEVSESRNVIGPSIANQPDMRFTSDGRHLILRLLPYDQGTMILKAGPSHSWENKGTVIGLQDISPDGLELAYEQADGNFNPVQYILPLDRPDGPAMPMIGVMSVFFILSLIFGMDITGLVVLGLVMGSFFSVLSEPIRGFADALVKSRGKPGDQADLMPTLYDTTLESGNFDEPILGWLYKLLPFLEGISFKAFWTMLWDPAKENMSARLMNEKAGTHTVLHEEVPLREAEHNHAKYSPGGRWLVSIVHRGLILFDRWAIVDGQMRSYEYLDMYAYTDDPVSFIFSPDGRTAAFVHGPESDIWILDLVYPQDGPRRVTESNIHWRSSLKEFDFRYSPDGKHLFWNRQDGFSVLNLSDLNNLKPRKFPGVVSSVSFSPHGDRMFFKNTEGYFFLNLRSPNSRGRKITSQASLPRFAPDKEQVVWGGQGKYIFFDLFGRRATRKPLPRYEAYVQTNYYFPIEVSQDGRYVAFSTMFATFVFDRNDLEEPIVFLPPAKKIQFGPDNKIVILSEDGQLRVFHLLEREATLKNELPAEDFYLSPNGQYLLFRIGVTFFLKDLSKEGGDSHSLLHGVDLNVDFGLDSSRMIVQTDTHLRVYNLASPDISREWEGSFYFGISPDGRHLIFSDGDETYGFDLFDLYGDHHPIGLPAEEFKFTPDGRHAILSRDAGDGDLEDREAIVKVGESWTVVQDNLAFARPSPDGAEVVYVDDGKLASLTDSAVRLSLGHPKGPVMPMMGMMSVFLVLAMIFGMDITGLVVLGFVMGAFVSFDALQDRESAPMIASEIAMNRADPSMQIELLGKLGEVIEWTGDLDELLLSPLLGFLPSLKGEAFDAFWTMIGRVDGGKIIRRLAKKDNYVPRVLFEAKELPVFQVKFSPEGRWIAVLMEAAGFILFDRWEGMRKYESNKKIDLSGFVFSPDGRTASFVDLDSGQRRVLNLKSFELVPIAPRQRSFWETSQNNVGEYSPDGKHLVWNATGRKKRFVVLNLSDLEEVRLRHFPGKARHVSFSSDGRSVIFRNGDVHFSLDLNRPQSRPRKITNSDNNLRLTPDRKQANWMEGLDSFVFDLSDQHRRSVRLPSSEAPSDQSFYRAIKISLDGRFIAFSTLHASYVFDRFQSIVEPVFVGPPARRLDLSSDNQYLLLITREKTLLRPLSNLNDSQRDMDWIDNYVFFSPNGKYLIRLFGPDLVIKDLQNETTVSYSDDLLTLNTYSFGLDSRRLIVNTEDSLIVFDLESETSRQWNGLFVTKISPDGRTLFFSDHLGTFAFDLSSMDNEEVTIFEDEATNIRPTADGRHLIFSVSSGDVLMKKVGPLWSLVAGGLGSVIISPDGSGITYRQTAGSKGQAFHHMWLGHPKGPVMPMMGMMSVFLVLAMIFGMDITGLVVLGLVMGAYLELAVLPEPLQGKAKTIAMNEGNTSAQMDQMPFFGDEVGESVSDDSFLGGLYGLVRAVKGEAFFGLWDILRHPFKGDVVNRVKPEPAYEPQFLHPKELIKEEYNLSSVQYSRGGQWLAVFVKGGFILFDRWNEMRKYEFLDGGDVQGFQFSPDGNTASFLDEEGRMKILDLVSMQMIPGSSDQSVMWRLDWGRYQGGYSPDGQHLHWDEVDKSVILNLWGLKSVEPRPFRGKIKNVSFSPDGNRMVFSIGVDVFSLNLGDPNAIPRRISTLGVKFTDDLEQAVWSSGRDAYLLNLSDSDREPIPLGHSDHMHSGDVYRKVETSRDGRYVSFSTPYATYVLDRFGPDDTPIFMGDPAGLLRFSPDSQHFVRVTGQGTFLHHLSDIEGSQQTLGGPADRVHFSPTGHHLVWSDGTQVFLRDLTDPQGMSYPIADGALHKVSFGVDSQRLVVNTETILQLSDLAMGNHPQGRPGKHVHEVSPDGRLLIFSDESATYALDLSNVMNQDNVMDQAREIGPPAFFIEFTPDGRHLILFLKDKSLDEHQIILKVDPSWDVVAEGVAKAKPSPDGLEVAYEKNNQSGHPQIYRLPLSRPDVPANAPILWRQAGPVALVGFLMLLTPLLSAMVFSSLFYWILNHEIAHWFGFKVGAEKGTYRPKTSLDEISTGSGLSVFESTEYSMRTHGWTVFFSFFLSLVFGSGLLFLLGAPSTFQWIALIVNGVQTLILFVPMKRWGLSKDESDMDRALKHRYDVEIERNPLDTIVIALDGEPGSGKTTVGRRLARELGWPYLEVGMMYRALTYKALKEGVRVDSEFDLRPLLTKTTIDVSLDNGRLRVLVDDRDVTAQLRTAGVDRAVAQVARYRSVHQHVFQTVRRIGEEQNIVVDGRNMGTDVFPDATGGKFYVTAGLDVLAQRRWLEFQQHDKSVTLEQVKRILSSRQRMDEKRPFAPARISKDAITIKTDDLSPEDVFQLVWRSVQEKLNPKIRKRSSSRTMMEEWDVKLEASRPGWQDHPQFPIPYNRNAASLAYDPNAIPVRSIEESPFIRLAFNQLPESDGLSVSRADPGHPRSNFDHEAKTNALPLQDDAFLYLANRWPSRPYHSLMVSRQRRPQLLTMDALLRQIEWAKKGMVSEFHRRRKFIGHQHTHLFDQSTVPIGRFAGGFHQDYGIDEAGVKIGRTDYPVPHIALRTSYPPDLATAALLLANQLEDEIQWFNTNVIYDPKTDETTVLFFLWNERPTPFGFLTAGVVRTDKAENTDSKIVSEINQAFMSEERLGKIKEALARQLNRDQWIFSREDIIQRVQVLLRWVLDIQDNLVSPDEQQILWGPALRAMNIKPFQDTVFDFLVKVQDAGEINKKRGAKMPYPGDIYFHFKETISVLDGLSRQHPVDRPSPTPSRPPNGKPLNMMLASSGLSFMFGNSSVNRASQMIGWLLNPAGVVHGNFGTRLVGDLGVILGNVKGGHPYSGVADVVVDEEIGHRRLRVVAVDKFTEQSEIDFVVYLDKDHVVYDRSGVQRRATESYASLFHPLTPMGLFFQGGSVKNELQGFLSGKVKEPTLDSFVRDSEKAFIAEIRHHGQMALMADQVNQRADSWVRSESALEEMLEQNGSVGKAELVFNALSKLHLIRDFPFSYFTLLNEQQAYLFADKKHDVLHASVNPEVVYVIDLISTKIFGTHSRDLQAKPLTIDRILSALGEKADPLEFLRNAADELIRENALSIEEYQQTYSVQQDAPILWMQAWVVFLTSMLMVGIATGWLADAFAPITMSQGFLVVVFAITAWILNHETFGHWAGFEKGTWTLKPVGEWFSWSGIHLFKSTTYSMATHRKTAAASFIPFIFISVALYFVGFPFLLNLFSLLVAFLMTAVLFVPAKRIGLSKADSDMDRALFESDFSRQKEAMIDQMIQISDWGSQDQTEEAEAAHYESMLVFGSESLRVAEGAAEAWNRMDGEKPVIFVTGGVGPGTRTLAFHAENHDLNQSGLDSRVFDLINKELDDLAKIRDRSEDEFWDVVGERYQIRKGRDREKKAQSDEIPRQKLWETFYSDIIGPAELETKTIEELVFDRLLDPETRQTTKIPEGLVYRAVLIAGGVAPDKIRVEAQSTTTVENIRFIKNEMNRHEPKSIAFMHNPYKHKRTMFSLAGMLAQEDPAPAIFSVPPYKLSRESLNALPRERLFDTALFLLREVDRVQTSPVGTPDDKAVPHPILRARYELEQIIGRWPHRGSSGSVRAYKKVHARSKETPPLLIREYFGFDVVGIWKEILRDNAIVDLMEGLLTRKYQKFLGEEGHQFAKEYFRRIRTLMPEAKAGTLRTKRIKETLRGLRKIFNANQSLSSHYKGNFRVENMRRSVSRVDRQHYRGYVVDLGADDNQMGAILLEEYGDQIGYILGVDIEEREGVLKGEKLGFKVQDKDTFKIDIPDGQADTIVIRHALHHMPYSQQIKYLEEIWRILKPGGRLVVIEDMYSTVMEPETEDEFGFHDQFKEMMADPYRARLVQTAFDIFSQGIKNKHMPFPSTYRTAEEWEALATEFGFHVLENHYLGIPLTSLHEVVAGHFILEKPAKTGVGAQAFSEEREQWYYFTATFVALFWFFASVHDGLAFWDAISSGLVVGALVIFISLVVFVWMHRGVVEDPEYEEIFTSQDGGKNKWNIHLYLFLYIPSRHLLFGAVTLLVSFSLVMILGAFEFFNPVALVGPMALMKAIIPYAVVGIAAGHFAGIGVHKWNNNTDFMLFGQKVPASTDRKGRDLSGLIRVGSVNDQTRELLQDVVDEVLTAFGLGEETIDVINEGTSTWRKGPRTGLRFRVPGSNDQDDELYEILEDLSLRVAFELTNAYAEFLRFHRPEVSLLKSSFFYDDKHPTKASTAEYPPPLDGGYLVEEFIVETRGRAYYWYSALDTFLIEKENELILRRFIFLLVAKEVFGISVEDLEDIQFDVHTENLSPELYFADWIDMMFNAEQWVDVLRLERFSLELDEDGGDEAAWFNFPGYETWAALIEFGVGRVVPVGLLIWLSGGVAAVSFLPVVITVLSMALIFKFGHLFAGRDALNRTFHSPAVDHITQLTLISALPLLLLPIAPFVAFFIYAVFQFFLTTHHHKVDNPGADNDVVQFVESMMGSVQRQLAEAPFEYDVTSQILMRETAQQIHIKQGNAAFLAGRAGLSLNQTRLLIQPRLVNDSLGLYSILMVFNWFGGLVYQFFVNLLNPMQIAPYMLDTTGPVNPNTYNVFDIHALLDDRYAGTALAAHTRDHLNKRIETTDINMDQPDVLLTRYVPTGNRTQDLEAEERAVQEARAALLENADSKMIRYIEKAVIVAEPLDGPIPPSSVMAKAASKLGLIPESVYQAHVYSALANHFDMTDERIQFVVYSLLDGINVIPISNRVKTALITSINA